MSTESPSPNRFGNLIAVLIAIVSMVGALVAWRVATAASTAGNADTEGLLAAVAREDGVTTAYITLYGHLTVYTRAVRHDALAASLRPVQQATADEALRKWLAQERDGLLYAADTIRGLIPQQYLDRERKFDGARDIGETIADYSLRHDTFPDAHFNIADAHRAKAEWLLAMLILLGGALVMFTLADAIASPLRYFFLLGGVGIFALGALGALLLELGGAPALQVQITF